MGFRLEEKTLSSGEPVTLVHWENESPTKHGDTLQNRTWKDSDTRSGLGFYDSTSEYMHNDWAQKNMSPQGVTVPDAGSLLLYHHAETDTWHSADALDIDHVDQWKDHFDTLKVASHADAHMAYNDTSNLRLLPAPVNRAREAAFRILEEHGADSPQWQGWVEKRFGFDADADRPGFDPDNDGAKRKRTTMEQPWSADDGRKGLSFDAAVLGKWYESKLEESHVDTVTLKSPTSGKMIPVPLFYCAASGQLCTRDALDIDHEIPFELLARKMEEHGGPNGLSKADALDGYNETSNLRLVGRSVNSSHEYEMDEEGNYRDDEEPEQPGEFDGLIASDDEDEELSPETISELQSLGRNYRVPETRVDQSGHRDNNLYQQALSCLENSNVGQGMSESERKNAAGTLTLAAKNSNLACIDAVATDNQDKSKLFAIEGDPRNANYVWVPVEGAKQQSLEQSTVGLNQLAYEREQQGQQQTQQRTQNAMTM